jgi:apolipoprotein N-acyltransferase
MRLKWGKEKMYRISKKVPKAERYGDWSWWSLFIVMIIMFVIFIVKVKGVI